MGVVSKHSSDLHMGRRPELESDMSFFRQPPLVLEITSLLCLKPPKRVVQSLAARPLQLAVVRGDTAGNRNFEMSSSGAAIATGECPWTLETGTVSFLTSYDGYSHLRPSYSQQYFRNRAAARRVACTSFWNRYRA